MEAYVAGQAQLGYAEFSPGPRSSDVILVSFPKSGSTWTSYLLHLLCSRGDHEFDDIKNVVVDITPGHWDPNRNPFLEEQTFQPRTYKTHGSSTLCPKGGKYIYLARDPKDSFISLYHLPQGCSCGSIKRFEGVVRRHSELTHHGPLSFCGKLCQGPQSCIDSVGQRFAVIHDRPGLAGHGRCRGLPMAANHHDDSALRDPGSAIDGADPSQDWPQQ